MIVFCPEEFINQISGKEVRWLEKGFVEFFSSETKNKMIVSNETWETFRFKVINDSPDKNEALNLIASFVSIFNPEELFLDDNHQEKSPSQEHTKIVMIEKTKSLIERNYADIEIIITNNNKNYVECAKSIPCVNIEGFFSYCMSIPKYRDIIEKYLRIIEYKKATGED